MILVSVPLALSGGLVGVRVAHSLTGGEATFDVIAMLGFVILAGLVVNNAILIVHQAGNFRREGMNPRSALGASARSRLRPISMSVITTVFGMLPLAVGGGAGAELYQGLGAVIVGGLVVSTLFTLFLVPVLLSLGHDLAEGWVARRAPASPFPPGPVDRGLSKDVRLKSGELGRLGILALLAVLAVVLATALRIEVAEGDPAFDAREVRGSLRSDPALLYYLTTRVVETRRRGARGLASGPTHRVSRSRRRPGGVHRRARVPRGLERRAGDGVGASRGRCTC